MSMRIFTMNTLIRSVLSGLKVSSMPGFTFCCPPRRSKVSLVLLREADCSISCVNTAHLNTNYRHFYLFVTEVSRVVFQDVLLDIVLKLFIILVHCGSVQLG